jgi:hypothetical protein
MAVEDVVNLWWCEALRQAAMKMAERFCLKRLNCSSWKFFSLLLLFFSFLSTTSFCTSTNELNFLKEQKNYSDSSFYRQLTGEVDDVIVTTLVGLTGSLGPMNGIGTIAKFNNPHGVFIAPDGIYALVTGYSSQLIRKIILSTASVSTFAGSSAGSSNGIGTSAKFSNPIGVSISPDGAYALIVNLGTQIISRITISTAFVTTFAGGVGVVGSTNGIGTNSRFYNPYGISISADGVYALVGDVSNHLIRLINISTASVTTFAGDTGSLGSTNGIGTNAQFNEPYLATFSPDGVYVLVSDLRNHLIRQIDFSTSSVTTLAGVAGTSGSTNGIGSNAKFNAPSGIVVSPGGVYALVGDRDNHLLRQIIISTASVTTLAGVAGSPGSTNGIGTNVKFYNPRHVSMAPDAASALVVDQGNQVIRKVTLPIPPSLAPSTSPSSLPSPAPSSTPSFSPTAIPSSAPSPLPIVKYSFGVLFGNHDILLPGEALLLDFLRDTRRGENYLPYSFHLIFLSSSSGKLIPLSGVVNSSDIVSVTDPPLPVDSLLIKWCPVTMIGIGSWEDHSIISGGRLLSWLVSLSSDEVKGFVVESEIPHPTHTDSFLFRSLLFLFRSSVSLLSHLLHRIYQFLLSKTLGLGSWHLCFDLSR